MDTDAITPVMEKAAEQARDEALRLHPLFERAVWDLEWLLATSPERGHRLSQGDKEASLYVQGTDVAVGTPVICVLFDYSDSKLFVHKLAAFPPKNAV